MRPNTSFGFRARQTSGPSPSRSMTPGRNPSISASAPATRRSTVSMPFGFFRSTAMLRRPRSSGSIGARPAARAVDAHHVRPHVGEQHGAERAGTDPGELEHTDAFERSHVRIVLRSPAVAARSLRRLRPARGGPRSASRWRAGSLAGPLLRYSSLACGSCARCPLACGLASGRPRSALPRDLGAERTLVILRRLKGTDVLGDTFCQGSS